MSDRRVRIASGIVALFIGAAIWLPCVHLFFGPRGQQLDRNAHVAPLARALAARHLQLWTDPAAKQRELGRMRRSNAEWDFMGRTFLVWSLAEMGLRQPERIRELLPVMDEIIDETLKLEREKGFYFFLMPYAKARPFVQQPTRSQFLDGEIAMMLAARRSLGERADYKTLLQARIQIMTDRMRQSSILCAESYPDECWTFCNVIGLAAIKTADYLDRTDHSAFLRDWLAVAKQKLLDPKTGLLVSSFTLRGEPLDGPEGSSIWLVAHCLRLIDEEFAVAW